MRLRSWVATLALALCLGCSAVDNGVSSPAEPNDATTQVTPAAADPAGTADTPSETQESSASEEAPLPLDPAVRFGTLENGLTYYVRENGRPENRAELRLVVNAGSLQEDVDQLGLAHFVEHMAFNGTENFDKQELVDYLERIGMRFGPDINAYTSFNETVYMLQIPTDDSEIEATAFQILDDWAGGVTFEGEEIDKERGVVVEEWRLGRGANGRIRDQQLPVMFHGSRYADRLVIGDKDILEGAPYEALERFYRDWYRPDLMAIVAVGDFEADHIVDRIREQFSDLEGPAEPRERVDYPVPDHEETLSSIVTDPEATGIRVTVGFKRDANPTLTRTDLRRALVDSLYHGMMIARLQELTLLPDPPFQFGFAASGWLGRTKSMYQIFAAVKDGGVERGLETLLSEAKRVEDHGFLQSELERAKTDVLRSIDRSFEERDKQESRRFASQYVQHYLEGDATPGIELTRDLYRELMPSITLDEINARADQWITEENRVILVSGPETEAAGIPDEQDVLAVFDELATVETHAWVDRTRDEPLVSEQPNPGRIVSESFVDELGAHRWELSNGVVVVLKPTDFKNDEVLLRGYSPGGHSLVEDSDYLSATQASSIAGQMGLGNFDAVELDKALTGKVAGAGAFIGELSEGVSGSASPQDLETMFQLVSLQFVGLRRDEAAFQSYLSTTRGFLENQEASPNYQFSRRFSEVASQNHPRREFLTLDKVDEISLDRAMAVYRDRFADASDFIFTIVGNFDLDGIREPVELWLGGLPSTGRDENWKDIGVRAPDGQQRFEVRSGIEPKASVRLVFHGDAAWALQEQQNLSTMAQVLRIQLREILREDLGGVYGVGVSGSMSREPRERFNVVVSFGCDPERVDELVDAVFQEIENLKNDGPNEGNIAKVQESQRRSRETSLRENRFWLSVLGSYERWGTDPAEFARFEERISAVADDVVKSTAQRYLAGENYLLGVLLPEDGGESSAP